MRLALQDCMGVLASKVACSKKHAASCMEPRTVGQMDTSCTSQQHPIHPPTRPFVPSPFVTSLFFSSNRPSYHPL